MTLETFLKCVADTRFNMCLQKSVKSMRSNVLSVVCVLVLTEHVSKRTSVLSHLTHSLVTFFPADILN